MEASIRHDWYQDSSSVTMEIFAKHLDVTKQTVEFYDSKVVLRLQSDEVPQGFERQFLLHNSIDPSRCSFRVTPMKLVISLAKASDETWRALERTESPSATGDDRLAYPSSARIKHDWDKLDRTEETSAEEPQSVDQFFKKLYADASEDTRRAMVKSFVTCTCMAVMQHLGRVEWHHAKHQLERGRIKKDRARAPKGS